MTDRGALHQLLLTTEEVTLLAQALAVAAMDDLNGDTEALTPSKASRIVWALMPQAPVPLGVPWGRWPLHCPN